MKRVVMTALTAVLVTRIAAAGPPEGLASPRLINSQAAALGTQTQEIREKQCRYQWLQPGTWTPREERMTASCVVSRWPVEGGLAKFIAVGMCESGFWRFASNGGNYLGLFQHAATSWLGRVRSYMPDGWRVGPWERWVNSRAQIVVTARMVHAGGWSPWSCA